jgi:hypothetical protein
MYLRSAAPASVLKSSSMMQANTWRFMILSLDLKIENA